MKSMTGYGSAQVEDGGDLLRVEVSSMNHRYLKISLRLPEQFQPYEREIEKLVRDAAARGSVLVTATYQPAGPTGEYVVDAEVIRRYTTQLGKLNKELNVEKEITLGLLLSLPGAIIVREDGAASGKKWKTFKSAFKTAIEEMVQMREAEGASLTKEIETRVRRLEASLDRVEKQAPRIVSAYAARLKKRVKALLQGTETTLNDQDIVREVALFAERSDVTEEICRLRSHLAQMMADALGVKLRVQTMPFHELLPALENNQVDAVLSGMTITPARNAKYAFVGPYLKSGKAFLAKSETIANASDAAEVNSPSTKVVALKGSTSQRFVELVMPKAQLTLTDNYDDAIRLVLTDQVHALVADYPVCIVSLFRYPTAP